MNGDDHAAVAASCEAEQALQPSHAHPATCSAANRHVGRLDAKPGRKQDTPAKRLNVSPHLAQVKR